MNVNEELRKWSEEYIPQFNILSKKYNTAFYTQSPLNIIDKHISLMIVGINPKGLVGSGSTEYTPEGFLKGNPSWNERFVDDCCKWKFICNARSMMGFDRYRNEIIDDDSEVVWTNLSPFESKNGFTDLPSELADASIESVLKLIYILHPKRIIFMGGGAFDIFDNHLSNYDKKIIEHKRLFINEVIEIGRIYDIPALYVSHASHTWPVKGSHYFTPMIIHLHGMIDSVVGGHPTRKFADVYNIIIKELDIWKKQLVIKETD